MDKNTIRRIVKEELAAKGIKPVREASGVSLSDIKDKAAFGNWVKTKMKNSIPSSVADADVANYIEQNPDSTTISGTKLADMFLAKISLGKSLPKMRDDELGKVDTALKAGTLSVDNDKAKKSDYSRGEADYATIGRELGFSNQNALNMQAAGMEKIKHLLGGVNIEDMDQDDLADVMDKIHNTADEVAGTVAKILANSSAEKAIELLSKHVDVGPQDAAGIKELKQISDTSGPVVAAQILVDDLLDTPSGESIFRFFQDMVAKVFRKEKDEEQVAAGVKGRRGRPSLADIQARAAAGDQKAKDYLAARAAKGK